MLTKLLFLSEEALGVSEKQVFRKRSNLEDAPPGEKLHSSFQIPLSCPEGDKDLSKLLKMGQKPQNFSGKDQSLGGWINAMELFFWRAKTSDYTKLWVAESFLEATPLNWYMNVDAAGGISG